MSMMKQGLLKHISAGLVAAAMFLGLIAGNAGADQRDPDLDGLFSELQRVGSDAAAKDVVAEISSDGQRSTTIRARP